MTPLLRVQVEGEVTVLRGYQPIMTVCRLVTAGDTQGEQICAEEEAAGNHF